MVDANCNPGELLPWGTTPPLWDSDSLAVLIAEIWMFSASVGNPAHSHAD